MRKLAFGLLAALSFLAPSVAAAQTCPAVAALPDSERRVAYSPSASTGPFSITFSILGDSTDYSNWIEVWLNGVRLTGVTDWQLTIPSGTLATACRPITNASITLTNAATGTLQIVGARRPRRTSQLSEGAGVTARNFNQVITDIVATERETWDKINDVTGRALIGLPGESITTLPSAANRASKFLGFDATGLIPVMTTIANMTGAVSCTTAGDFLVSTGPGSACTTANGSTNSAWLKATNPTLSTSDPSFTTSFKGMAVEATWSSGASALGHALQGVTTIGATAPVSGSSYGVVGAADSSLNATYDYGGVLGYVRTGGSVTTPGGTGGYFIIRGTNAGVGNTIRGIRTTSEVTSGQHPQIGLFVDHTSGAAFGSGIYIQGAVDTGVQVGGNGLGPEPTLPYAYYRTTNVLAFSVDASGSTTTTGATIATIASPPTIVGKRADGTASVPTAVQTNDVVLALNTQGYGATGYGAGGTSINVAASGNFSDTSQPTIISFFTVPSGSTTPTIAAQFLANQNLSLAARLIQAGSITMSTTTTGLLDISNTITNSATVVSAIKVTPTFVGGSTVPIGLYVEPSFTPSGTIADARGLQLNADAGPAVGVTITNLIGAYVAVAYLNTAGAVTTGTALQVTNPAVVGSLHPTTSQGIRILNQGIASTTTSYAMKIDAQSGSGTNYGIFTDDHVTFGTATKTIVLKQGANGTVGTFVCTSGGTITINNTNIAISDAIVISLNTVGGTISTPPATKAITAATSFQTLCATNDTSTYNYAIIKNAAWLLDPANDNRPMFSSAAA